MDIEEDRKQNIYRSVMLVIITAIITFLLTYMYVGNDNGNTYNVANNGKSATFEAIKAKLEEKYLGEIDEETLIEGAKKGYVEALGDPYTEYMTKEKWEDFMADTMGNYTGIGIYMNKNTDRNLIEIIAPIADSPAYKAGILAGDLILKIDDVEYTGDQITEASRKIKGLLGTQVKLEIRRGEEILTFNITRDNIKLNHVESKVLEPKIGYMKISTFDENCSVEFKEKLQELKDKKVTSIIIDLRNNPGGIVGEALDIANCFIDKGETLLITADKHGNKEYRKAKADKIIDVPIILLVNGGTASASEILAGALRDLGVAKLVGEKTYGKGVIQELIEFKNDGSALKVTTNEYYTPKESKINKVGLEPDVTVELPEGVTLLDLDEKNDTQLKKAIELLK